MALIRRTWPYGTQYAVKVVEAGRTVLLVEAPSIKEAFVLVNHGVTQIPPKGALGIITFTAGGPMGGYWKFTQ